MGILALVDSGADDCIFPASIASSLGIEIPNERAYEFSGAAPGNQMAYFETVSIGLIDWETREEVRRFELYCGFSSALEQTGLGLLGQEGFFSRFRVTIDRAGGYFEIE